MGREEGRSIRWNPGRSLGPADARCDEGGKLALPQPYPWLQVLWYGVEQGAHQPRLAAVHALQSVQPHVGCA